MRAAHSLMLQTAFNAHSICQCARSIIMSDKVGSIVNWDAEHGVCLG